MGGALLTRWLEQGLPHSAVTIIDPRPSGVPESFQGALVDDAISAWGVSPDPTLLVLGIKPQMLMAIAPGLGRLLQPGPLVLSMLAGISTTNLSALFPGAPIVRIMPNTPARIGRGITAQFALDATAEDKDAAEWLAQAAGTSVWLDAESQFDAVTAISGCGPAYLFRFVEALALAGESLGLDPRAAASLALETVSGAAELAARSDQPPSELRRQVTSPNGVTQIGLEALDGQGELSVLLRATVAAAANRSAEMSAEFAAASMAAEAIPPLIMKAR